LSGRHRHVVEQAKAHRLVGGGVMAWRANRAEGVPMLMAGDHRIDRSAGRAGSAQRGLGRARAEPGVFVQHDAVGTDRSVQYPRDMRLSMHARQLQACRTRCLDPIDRGIAIVVQCLQHGAQAGRAFGVLGTGVVLQARTMGEQLEHAAQPAPGLRRRCCCHNTSP
jgi:hypothetical protein